MFNIENGTDFYYNTRHFTALVFFNTTYGISHVNTS